jgi:hypothetical protein
MKHNKCKGTLLSLEATPSSSSITVIPASPMHTYAGKFLSTVKGIVSRKFDKLFSGVIQKGFATKKLQIIRQKYKHEFNGKNWVNLTLFH